MISKYRIRLWSSVLAITSSMLLFPHETLADKKKVLRTATILRLTDQFNDSIHAIQGGIEAAKVLFERTHPGVSIELGNYTHTEDLASVASATRKAIAEGYPTILGGELSEESLIIADVIQNRSVVFVTPTATNPRITENRPFVFAGSFSDKQAAFQVSKFLYQYLKAPRIGVAHNVSSLFADYASKQFLVDLESLVSFSPVEQRPAVFEEKYVQDAPRFGDVIERFKSNNVSHVVMLSHQTDFIRFATEAAEKGFYPTYMGSDAWGSNPKVLNDLLQKLPQKERLLAYRYTYWNENSVNSMTHAFKTVYESTTGMKPSAWAAVAFDSAWVLFTAMSQAQDSENSDQVRAMLKNIGPLSLVTSNAFYFDENNTPKRDLHVYRIDSKGIRFETSIK